MHDAATNFNNRRPMPPAILSLILLVCALAIITAGAQARVYEISNYDIEMTVTPDGSYVITEYITYNFIEGTFSTASREVPGKGFDGLRFISIEGIDHPIDSYEVKDGRNLSVEWTYPPTNGPASFRITYEATGALRSKDGFNVIDWNPIGSGWNVPINDIDVTITLPPGASQIDVDPQGDLVPRADGIIQFHRDHLPARTHYHVVLSFPEVISIVEQPRPPFGRWMLAGALVGLVLMVLDLQFKPWQRPTAATSGPAPSTLSHLQMAVLTGRSYQERRRGIAATIFALGQAGKLRLVVHPRKLVGSSQVHVEITNRDGLSEPEELIVDALVRRKTLQKFAMETKTFSTVLRLAQDSLIELGIISKERLRDQQKAYLSSLIPLFGTVVAFIYGAVTASPIWLGLGSLLTFITVGRLIGGALITTYTPVGLYVQDQVTTMLDATFKQLDEFVATDAQEAATWLFDKLPYLTLHRRFTATKINRLKRHLRRLEHVEAPDWLTADPAQVGKALDAVSALEMLDYMFIAILATSGSTGATGVPGAGAPGSGAGGGGGGAG